MATPETIQRQLIDAWNRRDCAAGRNLLHPQFSYTGSDGKELIGGPDTWLNIANAYASAFPDGRIEIRATYAQGNAAISEFRFTGTHQGELMGIGPTGRRVDLVVCNVMEIRDGKIHREREYFDAATMLRQLGLLTSPAQA